MSEAVASLSTPARAPRPLNQRQRRALAEQALERAMDAVQAVLEVLDTLDGEADAEPSLGAPEARVQCSELFGRSGFFQTYMPGQHLDQRDWARGGLDDREDEHDGREPDVDDEPSLGAREGHGGTEGWGEKPYEYLIDGEAQCEDEGFDADSEPDSGW